MLVLLVVIFSVAPVAQPVQAQTSFVVNSLADTDDGACTTAANGCTLREAINAANGVTGSTTITFSVSGEIRPTTPLPAIAGGGGTTINGGTGFTVILSGIELQAASRVGHGLRITSSNNQVNGLVIQRFPGGSDLSQGGSGIYIGGPQASNNRIYNNRIGTSADGVSAVGNTSYGVLLDNGASNNDIGGTGTNQRNLISGNNVADVAVIDETGQSRIIANNRIVGNLIGTNAAATAAISGGPANRSAGILISEFARSTEIRGNLIGGHTAGPEIAGIFLFTSATSLTDSSIPRDTLIVANDIGTTATGTAIQNRVGILIGSGVVTPINTIIGDPNDPVAGRNAIAGNNLRGIEIRDSTFNTDNVQIVGNYIGVARNGTTILGNGTAGATTGGEGIWIGQKPGSSTGRVTVGPANVIVGSRTFHLRIRSANNIVQGNLIGVNPAGTQTSATSASSATPLGWSSGDAAIYVENGTGNRIGGPTPGERNVIAAGGVSGTGSGAGVLLQPGGSGACSGACSVSGTIVEGNYLGVNAAGTTALITSTSDRTSREGIRLANTNGNTLRANVISGLGRGINFNASANNNTVENNLIGTRASGELVLSQAPRNETDGIRIAVGTGNTFTNNLIAFNGRASLPFDSYHGVRLGTGSTGVDNNTFTGNRLVQNGDFFSGHGIQVTNAQGIRISQTTAQNNEEDGIALLSGANGNLARPTFNAVTAGSPTVTGTASGCANCVIEIFTGAATLTDRNGEGPVYLTQATANASGQFSVNVTGCLAWVTATARNTGNNNTSPFSNALDVSTTGACTATPTLTLTAVGSTSSSTLQGNSATYTLNLAHNVGVERTYTITYTSSQGWGSGPTLVTVPPSGNANFTVTVSVPTTATAGTIDTTDVVARLDALTSSPVRVTTTAQAPSNNPAAPAVSGAQTRPASGASVTFTHTVTNTGDLAGNFSVIGPNFVGTPPAGWTIASATLGQTNLAGGASTTLTIVVNTPGTPPAGNVQFSFRVAVGSQQTPLVTNTISVAVVRSFTFVAQAPTSQSRPPGASAEYTYLLTNTGNASDSFQVTAPTSTTPTSGISFSVNPSTSFTLNAGASRTVTLTASVPTSPAPAVGNYNFSVVGRAVGGTAAPANQTANGTLQVTGGGAPEFVGNPTITPAPVPGLQPATDVTIVYNLRNAGNVAAPFILPGVQDGDLPTGWTLQSQTTTCTGNVPTSATPTCTMTTVVQVPANAPAGDYAVRVRITANNSALATPSPNVAASAEATVTVAFAGALTLTPTPLDQTGIPDAVLTYTHTLRNTGNGPDSFTLSFTQTDPSFSVTISPTQLLNVPRNATRSVSVLVRIPTGVPADTESVISVTARSQGTPSATAVAVDTARVAAFDGATLSPGTFQAVQADNVVLYTHTLTNTGSTALRYTLAVENTEVDWPAPQITSDNPTAELAPGETTTVTLEVIVPEGVRGGTFNTTTVRVFAFDTTTPVLASAENVTLVGEPFEVIITPDRTATALPNSTLVLTHTVTNIGTNLDNYTLTARDARGFPASVAPNDITLGPGQSREVTMTLTLPVSARAGELAFVRVEAISQAAPEVSRASVTDQVTVLQQADLVLGASQFQLVTNTSGEVRLTPLSIANLGNATDTFDLEVLDATEGWRMTVTPNAGLRAARGETIRSIALTVTVPRTITPGSSKVMQVRARSRFDPSVEATITVELFYSQAVNIVVPPPPPPRQRLYLPMIQQ
jgi:CSLREA domain-containing protein